VLKGENRDETERMLKGCRKDVGREDRDVAFNL
jgi:hypothetical protein